VWSPAPRRLRVGLKDAEDVDIVEAMLKKDRLAAQTEWQTKEQRA
jgi:hypothetical protein